MASLDHGEASFASSDKHAAQSSSGFALVGSWTGTVYLTGKAVDERKGLK